MTRKRGRMPLSERLDREPVGIEIGLGMVAMLAALMVAAVLPASAGPWRLTPVAVVLLALGAVTARLAAVGFVATVGFLLYEGFLVNRYGVLSWHGLPDLYRLLVVIGASGAGVVTGTAHRWRHQRPLRHVPPEWAADSRSTAKDDTLTREEREEAGRG